ncbi:hypothetical protein NitYY0826_C0451 [Nitratiruptor sp. YY08-26]|uniref:BatD family protein n=1 Tax=unclassified Nitratiruptor TaxID=2624044 RepID=UPI0019167D3F|nr:MULTISPECIES: BatD family protein [unclassified Nitratiruptor]BCD61592.1 hypothetical protein NitYY0813_C0450 [Nitratiruptor sp. YY08-13]BCD65526.1 hypothetical protein NitYY0826_C0451 [Nitratiruptor sp. YY08-26]
MRILGSLVLVVATLLAGSFKVYLEQNPIYQGEPAKLVMEASGDEIELPKIEKIGPYPVSGVSKSESVVNVNGNLTVKKSQIVVFYPDTNVTIPSFTAKVDGEEIKSDPLELVVKKAKKNSNIFFTLKLNKKEAYVGEPIIAELELKIRRTLNIIDYQFQMPKFDNFWVKELKSSNKYLEEHGEYLIKRIKFLLLPQRSGVLHIAPGVFKYAIPDNNANMFGFVVTAPRWYSTVSNGASVIVKPLPQNVDLVGDFTMQVQVDKKRVKPNEPVNLYVKIEGIGNLENFDGIDLNISDVTIYADKPKIKERYTEQGLQSSFEQKFSIIADHSYTIPAIRLRYFSLKQKSIQTLQSDPINIEVVGGRQVAANLLQQSPTQPQQQTKQLLTQSTAAKKSGFDWISFIYGVIAGIVVMLGIYFAMRLKKQQDIWKFEKSDKRELLKKLLPYVAQSKEAASLAQALYEEIYEGKKHRITRKEVEKVLKDLV